MLKKSSFLFLFCVLNLCLLAQEKPFDFGIEVQVYPTGVIPGLHLQKAISPYSAMNLRLGYQQINHRDLGVHESEIGSGFGFTIGYRQYFREGHDGFVLDARNDFWWNTLNWKDNIDSFDELRGQSKIIVAQPTLKGGYSIVFGQKDDYVFTPTIAFGYEINVKTEGSPVGEGAILLLGIELMQRF